MTENRHQSQPDLAEELAETAATLARLGATLVGLPVALLPPDQRERAKQLTTEIFQVASALPRAVSGFLEESREERQGGEKGREDLGSRLRRERKELERENRRAARYGAQKQGTSPDEGEEQIPGEAPATEEVEEEIQELWNMPPTEPDEAAK